MEAVNKLIVAATNVVNSNIFVDIVLAGSLGLLTWRSVNQQKAIEALEAEKKSLLESNKVIKKTIWDWKQQLFAEAASDSAVVPLSRLKAIYGETVLSQTVDAGKEEDIATRRII